MALGGVPKRADHSLIIVKSSRLGRLLSSTSPSPVRWRSVLTSSRNGLFAEGDAGGTRAREGRQIVVNDRTPARSLIRPLR